MTLMNLWAPQHLPHHENLAVAVVVVKIAEEEDLAVAVVIVKVAEVLVLVCAMGAWRKAIPTHCQRKSILTIPDSAATLARLALILCIAHISGSSCCLSPMPCL